MRKTILYIAALASVFAACNKVEEPAGEVKMVTETVTGTREGSTKVTIANSNGAFSWTEGDNIAVHVSDGDVHKYVFTTDAGASGASAAAASASFTVTYEEGSARDAFAVFPSGLVAAEAADYGQSGASLDVTLPASYTLAQLTGETTPCPMVAANTPGSGLEFYQLCGMLRLTVSNIPPSTASLKIDFNGRKVQGAFSIESPVTPGTSTIVTGATEGNDDIITVTDLGISGWTDGVVMNIPLPTGDYTKVTVTACDGSGKAVISVTRPLSDSGVYTASRARGRKVAASIPLFSLSATKKVTFAPGNLQYLGKADGTGTWRFADHQYDFLGDGPSSGTSYQGNVDYTGLGYGAYNTGSGSSTPTDADKIAARDLFGWGTSGYNGKYPYLTSTGSGSYYSGSLVDEGANYDWGVYNMSAGDYSWLLPTTAEWSYLIGRTNKVYTREGYKESKKLYCDATLSGVSANDVYGIIIFPDGWAGDPIKTIKYQSAGFDKNVFTADQWEMLEDLGCVFLPAAHTRDGSTIKYLNEGHYWSSTVHSTVGEYRGGCLEFWSGGILSSTSNNRLRRFGQSVRLIRVVE